MSDEKKFDPAAAIREMLGARPRPIRSTIPKQVRHDVQIGFSPAADAEQPTLALVVPGDHRPMIARKIMVAPEGWAIVEMRHNGDPVGFEDEFRSWRAREYVDEDDPRWRDPDFCPAAVEGTYAVDEHNVLPLLHLGDRLEVVLAWRGAGPPPDKFFAVLFGVVYDEESDVSPWEISFDSGTLIEPGESREMHIDLDRVFRADRFWVAGGPRSHRCFAIEQIFIGARNQLAAGTEGVPASVVVSAPRAYIETARVGVRATIVVRCVDSEDMPRHFRGKLIGVTVKPSTVDDGGA